MNYTITDVTRNINYAHTERNLGFISHWKLTFQLWCMVLNFFKLVKSFTPLKSIYMIPWTLIILIIKTPWFLFIKPFGIIYSCKTTWIGSYSTRNNRLLSSDVKKHIAHKLFGITFLKYRSKMNADDWAYISK